MLRLERQIAIPPGLGATVRRALHWWLGELATLVPGALRRTIAPHRTRLRVLADENEVSLVRQVGGSHQLIGRLSGAGAARSHAQQNVSKRAENAVICLPASRILRTAASLPLAAESNLNQVVAFEFERLVPFRRAESYFAYRVVSRNAAARSLRIELTVAPRIEIDGLTRLAKSAGYNVVAVEAAGGTSADPIMSLPFDGSSEGRRRSHPGLINGCTAAFALILALVCLAIPFVRTENALATLTSEVAQARRRADMTFDLRKRIESQIQTQAALVLRRDRTPTIAGILDTVTRLTPDGTWLTDLRVNGSQIQLVGFSPSASNLLRLVDRSPRFKDAAFALPITREEPLDRERFSISAEIVPKEAK